MWQKADLHPDCTVVNEINKQSVLFLVTQINLTDLPLSFPPLSLTVLFSLSLLSFLLRPSFAKNIFACVPNSNSKLRLCLPADSVIQIYTLCKLQGVTIYICAFLVTQINLTKI